MNYLEVHIGSNCKGGDGFAKNGTLYDSVGVCNQICSYNTAERILLPSLMEWNFMSVTG